MVKHECDRCKRAKLRIADILWFQSPRPGYTKVTLDDDFKDKKGKIKPMFPNQVVSDFLPAKDYYPDVYAEKIIEIEKHKGLGNDDIIKSQPVIIEIDHTHISKNSTVKDKRRDKHFLSKGIPTVRFPVGRVIGSRKWYDFIIMDLIEKEIKYQLR
jgi:hypothetical protein